jgi:hypothetical protein
MSEVFSCGGFFPLRRIITMTTRGSHPGGFNRKGMDMQQAGIRRRSSGFKGHRNLAIQALLLSLAMVLALCAFGGRAAASADTSPAKSSSSVTKTKVKVENPFTADGHIKKNLRVGDHLLGRCWEGSIVNQQKNAWRCFSGNVIHDPCFKHKGVRDLVCMRTPWSRTVQRLRLTRRLPRNGNGGIEMDSQPWGFKLFNGLRCVLGGGTANWVGTVALPYECSRHHSGGIANQNHPIWKANIAPRSLDRLHIRRVKKAWF